MDFFKKTVIIAVIISFLVIHFSQTGLAWQDLSYIKTAKATSITKHAPEFLAPPELTIPVETKAPEKVLEKGKTNKWLWVGLGVLVAGVLAGAGGGGGGGGGPTSSSPQETGDITINWNE